jgi:hypothetical protein
MAGLRIERYSVSRRRSSGCGCLFISGGVVLTAILAVLVASGAITPLLFGILGVERVGSTESLFTDATSAPATAIVSGRTSNSVHLNLGSYGVERINGVAVNTDGNHAATRLNESTLLSLCAQRTAVCRGGNAQLRNVAIDLRNGGAVIYADAFTGVNWQRVGIVLQLDSATSFSVAGVDVGGVTYNANTLPFGLSDSVGDLVRDVEREGNAILRQLSAHIGGDSYRLQSITTDDNTLIISLRSTP